MKRRKKKYSERLLQSSLFLFFKEKAEEFLRLGERNRAKIKPSG